jgi:hypothetical protein
MRDGQRAFNLLYKFYPDIAEKIRGGEFDPFYDDRKLTLFYREVGRLLILRLEIKDEIIGDFE